MDAADPNRFSILVVDDDPASMQALTEILTSAGYRVMTASNGIDGVRILTTDGPPLVIADWSMPGMDGPEFCRGIRGHEGIPFAFVILVTSAPSEARLLEAFEAGADDFLPKSVSPQELLARIHAGERAVILHRDLERRNLDVHRINAEIEVAWRKLSEANATLNRMATTDELTGLLNRREALARLEEYWSSAARHGHTLSCMALDIDRFKSFNDVYGHAVGDAVLRETADILRKSARREERVCRIGGEEFLILCPFSTESQAAAGAERLRKAVETNVVVTDTLELSVTMSFGVAERTPEMTRPDDLLRAADDALYAAKDAGRNRVCLASDRSDSPASEVQAEAPERRHNPEDGGSEEEVATVLVVDDDAGIRTFCARLLEREGFRILTAADGAIALEILNEHRPNVIVTDAIMPHLTGLDLTRTLKAGPDTRDIPVIMTTARTDQVDVQICLESGADEFLHKPIDAKELIFRVRSMLRLGERGSELALSYAARGEQSRALTLLLDYVRELESAADLGEALERTLTRLADLACARRVAILVPDEQENVLTVAESIGPNDDDTNGISIPMGAFVSGHVFATGQAIELNTPGSLPKRACAGDSRLFPLTPLIVRPLTIAGEVVGILAVAERRGGQPFEPHELAYVDLVGSVAAGVIDHHRRTCLKPAMLAP